MRTFREQLEVMMANEQQSFKSSEKFFDEEGCKIAKARISLLQEVIDQYELDKEKSDEL